MLSGRKCPYCGSTDWTGPLGGGDLRPGALLLTYLDEYGDRSRQEIEVIAFTCLGCGYLRFHNPEVPAVRATVTERRARGESAE